MAAIHACGLRADTAEVACWPLQPHVAPPDGVYRPGGEPTPPDVAPAAEPPTNFVALDAGWEHTCALRSDGTVACWGESYHGQAGLTPDEVDSLEYAQGFRFRPEAVVDEPTGLFAGISAGGEHTCAVRTDGTVACWGGYRYLQAVAPDGLFRAVAAGGWHTCVLHIDGTVDCWGLNDVGTRADNLLGLEGSPLCRQRTEYGPRYCWSGGGFDPDGVFSGISAGGAHTCGLRLDGTVACWGHGPGGRVDVPDDAASPSWGPFDTILCWTRPDSSGFPCAAPGDVGQADAPEGAYTAIAAGGWHTCALRTDRTIACWGHGTQQVDTIHYGPGATVPPSSVMCRRTNGIVEFPCVVYGEFGQAAPPAGTFTAVAAGWGHTCAIRTDNTVACWGDNVHGQADPPPGEFTTITAGGTHTCGLRADKTIACWGAPPRHVQPPDGVQWH